MQDEPIPRLLTKARMQEIFARIQSIATNEGYTGVSMRAWWRGELRWARNRVSLASDRRDYTLLITRIIDGAQAVTQTNRVDEEGLTHLIRGLERETRYRTKGISYSTMSLPDPVLPYPKSVVWSDATYTQTPAARTAVAQTLMRSAESQGMYSAGYLEMRAGEQMRFSSETRTNDNPSDKTQLSEPGEVGSGVAFGEVAAETPARIAEGEYIQHTQSQCSMTVRHPRGLGSGWAGLSGYDWHAIDAPVLAERALQKCLASMNPVAIEPGRYTVILEPQAVAELLRDFFGSFTRKKPESGLGPWALENDRDLGLWRTRLGLKVTDERITVSHDPNDPLLGVLPERGMRPLTYIERGVLQTLWYDRGYAITTLNQNLGALSRPGFQVSGGSTSMDEMIATTKRGILVTRFSSLYKIDDATLLTTGFTRDGLWLIENGTLTKAVRNMRFTDSPLIVLNRIEQLGPPVPVFGPQDYGLAPCIVPPIKSSDFAFTSTIDAI